MPKGFLNPDNAAKSSGSSFREGPVRVAGSVFRVHQSPPREGQPERVPVTAMVWDVIRLDEDLEPLTTDDGEPLHEELPFSLGGKSLSRVHPGLADSPDDEDDDIEDAGDEVNAEGPTLKLIDSTFRPHEKSSIVKLMSSLKNAGYKPEYVERVWAPDFIGLVAFMSVELDKDMMQEYTDKNGKLEKRPTAYKVVSKIISAPYEKKDAGKKAPAGKKDSATASTEKVDSKVGKNSEAEAALKPILEQLSTDRDGSTMSRKAFNNLVTTTLQSQKVSPKLHVPIISLIKDDAWLTKNGPKFDISFDAEEGKVTFGTPEESAEE
jgi:hypothetical protein